MIIGVTMPRITIFIAGNTKTRGNSADQAIRDKPLLAMKMAPLASWGEGSKGWIV